MNTNEDICIYNASQFLLARNELLTKLISDGKILDGTDGRKFNSLSNCILKNYDCANLIATCHSGTFDELLYCLIHDDSPYNHMCQVCGRPCGFTNGKYHGTCRSKSCLCQLLLNNEDIKDFHQFIIDNYVNGDKEFHHTRIGFIEKYHVYSNSQLGDWQKHMNEVWATKSQLELEQRKRKTIETCRKKYNTDWAQQDSSIIKRQKNTWRGKTKEQLKVKNERRIKTTQERYGVDHVMRSKEIIDFVRERHFRENGYYHWLHKKVEHKDIYLDDDKFKQYVIGLYKNNGNTRVKKTELDSFFNINVKHRCEELHLMKYIQVFTSQMEEQFKKLFDDNGIYYIWRCRSIVDGTCGDSHKYELDFYLPDSKVGVEINDLSGHNSIVRSSRPFGEMYHLHKTECCNSKGIRLIHIWEWEIKKDFGKVSRWLLNELNSNKRVIYARKCVVRSVDYDEEKKFLNTYHLQGYSKSEQCLGLYYDNELVQLMSFVKSRFTDRYEYELLRLCTMNNVSVTGGSSRLFKHFVEQVNPKSIVSYCDYSKFRGDGYTKMGMTFNKRSSPTVTYCNWDMRVINESLLVKIGADNLLDTSYGKGVSNREIMLKEGFLPVHNCGNLIFEWINKDKKEV